MIIIMARKHADWIQAFPKKKKDKKHTSQHLTLH